MGNHFVRMHPPLEKVNRWCLDSYIQNLVVTGGNCLQCPNNREEKGFNYPIFLVITASGKLRLMLNLMYLKYLIKPARFQMYWFLLSFLWYGLWTGCFPYTCQKHISMC